MKIWSHLRAAIKDGSPSLIAIGRLGASAVGLLSAPIVARALGPDGRGETAAAIALFYLVPILLGLGLPLEVRRLSAISDGRAVIRTARILCVIGFIPSIVIGLVLVRLLFGSLALTSQLVVAAGIFLAPLMLSWMCDQSVLIAERRYRPVMVIQVAQPVTFLVLVVIAWTFGIASTETILAANVLGTVVTFVLGLVFVRGGIRGERAELPAMLRGALKYAGSAAAEAASNRLDQVLVLPLVGAYQAGIYSVAVTIGAVPLALGHSLGASFFTSVATAKGEERIVLKGAATRSGLAMGIASGIILAIVSPVAIPIVFGEEFVPSIPVTLISLVGSIALVAAFVCSSVLAAEGKGIRMTIAQVVSLALAIVLLYVLSPSLGAIGAAIASSIGYICLLGVLLVSMETRARRVIPSPRDFKASVSHLINGA